MRQRIDRSVGRHFFGTDPETYDAVRPGHAADVYETLRTRCGLRAGSSVLEIGPGTGQATRRLLDLGAHPLVAIEPDPALARYLRDTLGERVEVRLTALEDAELESGTYDVAAAASSFHWVEEDAGLEHLAAALRPGGWVALWWTSFGDERRPDPFMIAVDPLFEDVPHGPSGPSASTCSGSASTSGERPSFARDAERRLAALARAGFEEPAHEDVAWTRTWDTAGIRGLYSTFSPLSALEPDRREQLLDAVARVAATAFSGRVEKPLVTSLYTARKPL